MQFWSEQPDETLCPVHKAFIGFKGEVVTKQREGFDPDPKPKYLKRFIKISCPLLKHRQGKRISIREIY